MNAQLKKDLDRRFGETHRHFEEKLEETHRLIGENGRGIAENRGLIEENSRRIEDNGRRIEDNSRRIDGNTRAIKDLKTEMNERFDGVDEKIRHTHVVVEGLRSDVQLLAETLSAFDQRLTRLAEAADAKLEDFRAAVQEGFRFLHQRDDGLDLRVTRLETAQAGPGGR